MIATMNNVMKRYGEKLALDNLNLNVVEGEILGLLGPNGAGKTTAIHILCGLINADSGDIIVFDKVQNIKNLDIRKDMGLVTQSITVFQDLSAIENLRYFGSLYGLRGAQLNQAVIEALEFVGLSEHGKKKPKTFSGGMQRRLNIACAIIHKPKLVIMDEPTVGVDPQSRNHILESVKKIAANGTTVIYTSHYMEEVEAVCDRVSIMDAGRVVVEGTIEDLINRIQHEQKVHFSALMPSDALTADVKAIAGVKDVVVSGNVYTVTSAYGSQNVSRIMEIVGRHGGVTSFSEDKPNLEDVFLTLTGKRLRDEREG